MGCTEAAQSTAPGLRWNRNRNRNSSKSARANTGLLQQPWRTGWLAPGCPCQSGTGSSADRGGCCCFFGQCPSHSSQGPGLFWQSRLDCQPVLRACPHSLPAIAPDVNALEQRYRRGIVQKNRSQPAKVGHRQRFQTELFGQRAHRQVNTHGHHCQRHAQQRPRRAALDEGQFGRADQVHHQRLRQQSHHKPA